MTDADEYQTLDFSPAFLQSLIGPDFTNAERRRFLRALERLDTNERHPSLRVHQLRGRKRGSVRLRF